MSRTSRLSISCSLQGLRSSPLERTNKLGVNGCEVKTYAALFFHHPPACGGRLQAMTPKVTPGRKEASEAADFP